MASSESLLPVSSQQDPLSDSRRDSIPESRRRRPIKVHLAIYSGFLLIALYVTLVITHGGSAPKNDVNDDTTVESRARLAGVSEKSNDHIWNLSNDLKGEAFAWNNTVLSWQRTAFHFQPEKNWMNGINTIY
ncbi:hypothetical protein DY000_02012612 [Brassica cretica]|uniref:beta-fructofuranosidase n=1 Tax=Brassica cretica TaxID=69181 RepID=A0ABQ7D592_BRACR|nr:hypothetical protein DY000_02012612 [Brassica cretica]